MLVSEIFYTIQGEGALTGVPSVFVRTAGCNLRCRWCDTKYSSWDPEGQEMGIDEIVATIALHPTRFCVITGGEPMISKAIYELTRRLGEMDKHVTVETAATVAPKGLVCSLASLSPKMSNSSPGDDVPAALRESHEKTRLQPDVIREWIDGYDFQLKFVVGSREDVDEVLGLLTGLERDIPPERVLLMPEGTEVSAIDTHSAVALEACEEYGFRYCDRLHIRLFGNTRGR